VGLKLFRRDSIWQAPTYVLLSRFVDDPLPDDDLEVLGLRRRAAGRSRKNRRAPQTLRETPKIRNEPHFPHSSPVPDRP
jgi:hypothetical protein